MLKTLSAAAALIGLLGLAGAANGQASDPGDGIPVGLKPAIGRFSTSGRVGALLAWKDISRIIIAEPTSAGSWVELDRLDVIPFTFVTAGDLDADGIDEVVLYHSSTHKLQIITTSGGSDLIVVNTVTITGSFTKAFADSTWEFFDEPVIILTGTGSSYVTVFDPLGTPAVGTDTPPPEYTARPCSEKFITSYEGECSRSTQGEGILACLDAAACRQGDCKFLSCMSYRAGDYNILQAAAEMTGCDMIAGLEGMACIPRPFFK